MHVFLPLPHPLPASPFCSKAAPSPRTVEIWLATVLFLMSPRITAEDLTTTPRCIHGCCFFLSEDMGGKTNDSAWSGGSRGGEARQALYLLSVALLIAVYRTTRQQFIKRYTRVQGTLLWACLGLWWRLHLLCLVCPCLGLEEKHGSLLPLLSFSRGSAPHSLFWAPWTILSLWGWVPGGSPIFAKTSQDSTSACFFL